MTLPGDITAPEKRKNARKDNTRSGRFFVKDPDMGIQMELTSPAKLNLFLHVTGKRPDGYHDLFSLMAPIGLNDKIGIELRETGIKIHCRHPDVPKDASNLAHRAAVLFFNETGIHKGCEITIEKNIPVAGGLGGGSSNAAAVLMGLNDLFEKPIETKRLFEMGLSLGADVPFFIFGKTALAKGVGEILEPYCNLYPYYVILILPGFHVSTQYVFKNLNYGLTKTKKTHIDSYFDKGVFDPRVHMHNDLESVTACKYEQINYYKEMLDKNGAVNTLMSGSGPTVFGLYMNKSQAQNALLKIQKCIETAPSGTAGEETGKKPEAILTRIAE